MEWYWLLIIGWTLCGLIALFMEFQSKPEWPDCYGWEEFWPVILGPLWLIRKITQWALAAGAR